MNKYSFQIFQIPIFDYYLKIRINSVEFWLTYNVHTSSFHMSNLERKRIIKGKTNLKINSLTGKNMLLCLC